MRTYRLGYRVSVTITRGPQGPYTRVAIREQSEDADHSFDGLASYESLADLETLAFAILEELGGVPEPGEPF